MKLLKLFKDMLKQFYQNSYHIYSLSDYKLEYNQSIIDINRVEGKEVSGAYDIIWPLPACSADVQKGEEIRGEFKQLF